MLASGRQSVGFEIGHAFASTITISMERSPITFDPRGVKIERVTGIGELGAHQPFTYLILSTECLMLDIM